MGTDTSTGTSTGAVAGEGQPAVYGDAAYGSGELLERLEAPGSTPASRCIRHLP